MQNTWQTSEKFTRSSESRNGLIQKLRMGESTGWKSKVGRVLTAQFSHPGGKFSRGGQYPLKLTKREILGNITRCVTRSIFPMGWALLIKPRFLPTLWKSVKRQKYTSTINILKQTQTKLQLNVVFWRQVLDTFSIVLKRNHVVTTQLICLCKGVLMWGHSV